MGVDQERRSERPSARPDAASLVGKLLSDRYLIERLLGQGGMGAVYLAEHTHMRKKLAVKVLHAEMTRLPEIVARFEREAMAAAHIDHPNVAAATDFGKLEDGSFFLVLEYVEGRSLRDALGGKRLELGRALHVLRQVASGLARAHALKIVHRDLKPENVMLITREDDPDFVKILDFGIAKVPVGDLSDGPRSGAGAVALTRVGMVFGTPEYMAPEQAMGETVDGRADLYSLGVLAFEMLTGSRPFEHANAATLLAMQITAPVPKMAIHAPEANVPPEVEAIIDRLLEKDVARRFADGKEVAAAVSQVMLDLVASGRVDPTFADRAATSGAISLRSLSSPRLARASSASLDDVDPSSPQAPAVVAGTAPTVASSPAAPPSRGGAEAVPITSKAIAAVQGYAQRIGPRARTWGGVAAGALVVAIGLRLVLAANQTPSGVVENGRHVEGPDTAFHPPPPPPVSHAIEEHLASAEARIESADYSGAIAELTALERDHPELPAVHRELEHAYASNGDAKDALREAELWLPLDPGATSDARLLADLRADVAGKDEPVATAATALLATLGTAGPDALYDLAYGQAHAGQTRARAALTKPEVRAHASQALAAALDLRAAPGCEAKRALVERAGEVGDARALTLLKGYQQSGGCGFLGMRDCWPCLHRDGSLAHAIEDIESRAPRP